MARTRERNTRVGDVFVLKNGVTVTVVETCGKRMKVVDSFGNSKYTYTHALKSGEVGWKLNDDGVLVDSLGRTRKKADKYGIDFFRASEPVEIEYAHKIVQEFAKQHNIAPTEVVVRARLPKSNIKQARPTNDANLVLAHSAPTEAEATKKDDLTTAVQALHDAHKGVHGKQKEQPKKEEKKPEAKHEKAASAANPEGATIKRADAEKQKRGYRRKPAEERSAKSRAAYLRYVKEIEAAAAQSPTFMESVKPGPGVTQAQIDEETMKLAMSIAEILRKHSVL